ncbi:tripartite ATP-independent transporter DctP family solute receptor [Geomicrobium halophilum]|uniref:Tripartite ATP-independent transporter DctP family solute receptor n=1 Tax=Geomicrobium halophilum TaxID=549000 RepID=A0A841PMK9_9BACL|nr:TRAP transporter substrate-binding protein [Geomicrobium halophilum]MBB6449990.1 tripartite ATP-independent transporter DctP family solute receptor [Geomicrobium halophilum]
MIKKDFRFLVLLSVVGLLTACNAAEEADGDNSIHLIMATQLDANSPFAAGFEKFQDVLEEKSNGEMTAEIHTDGALGGNEDELVRSLETGAVDMTVVSPGFMTQAVEEVDLFSLPYLFTSEEHWEQAMDGEVGEETRERVEDDSNLRVLDYWSAGVRHYYGFEPIEEPEDLRNVSIRAQDSPAVQDAWESLGALPTSVAWDEMYQGLQNRVVDASENDLTNIYQASHHEIAPHITLTEHDFTTRMFLTSDRVFEQLDDEQEAIFWEAVEEATEMARETDMEMAEESKELLIEEGAEIHDVDIVPFIEETEEVRERAAEELGVEELYEKIADIRDEE